MARWHARWHTDDVAGSPGQLRFNTRVLITDWAILAVLSGMAARGSRAHDVKTRRRSNRAAAEREGSGKADKVHART